jgi:hypothetical protein
LLLLSASSPLSDRERDTQCNRYASFNVEAQYEKARQYYFNKGQQLHSNGHSLMTVKWLKSKTMNQKNDYLNNQ